MNSSWEWDNVESGLILCQNCGADIGIADNEDMAKTTIEGCNYCYSCGCEMSKKLAYKGSSTCKNSEKVELKPCPFCGGEASGHVYFGNWLYKARIKCNNCNAETKLFSQLDYNDIEEAKLAAVEAWNRRIWE